MEHWRSVEGKKASGSVHRDIRRISPGQGQGGE